MDFCYERLNHTTDWLLIIKHVALGTIQVLKLRPGWVSKLDARSRDRSLFMTGGAPEENRIFRESFSRPTQRADETFPSPLSVHQKIFVAPPLFSPGPPGHK